MQERECRARDQDRGSGTPRRAQPRLHVCPEEQLLGRAGDHAEHHDGGEELAAFGPRERATDCGHCAALAEAGEGRDGVERLSEGQHTDDSGGEIGAHLPPGPQSQRRRLERLRNEDDGEHERHRGRKTAGDQSGGAREELGIGNVGIRHAQHAERDE